MHEVFFAASNGGYPDILCVTHLEYGSNIHRNSGRFFFLATLNYFIIVLIAFLQIHIFLPSPFLLPEKGGLISEMREPF